MIDGKPSDFEFIEPCIASITFRGKIDHPELTTIFDGFEPFVRDQPHWGLEVDMRALSGATPDARRVGAERISALPKVYVAIISSNFAQRMVAKLVITAIQILHPGHTKAIAFFSDKEAARKWMLEIVATTP